MTELGLDPAEFRTSHLALSGYLHAAQLRKDSNGGDAWQHQAATAGAAFVGEATRKLNGLIERAAARNSGWLTRSCYETMFLIFPGFLLYRIGRNYFYDSFWLGRPLLDLGFYIPSLIFLALWCALFLWRFLARLRRGVQAEIQSLANSLADTAAWDELFGDLASRCRNARDQFTQLQWLQSSVKTLRQSLEDDSRLGGRQWRNSA